MIWLGEARDHSDVVMELLQKGDINKDLIASSLRSPTVKGVRNEGLMQQAIITWKERP